MHIVSGDGTLHGCTQGRDAKAPGCRKRERKTYRGEYRRCFYGSAVCTATLYRAPKVHSAVFASFVRAAYGRHALSELLLP
jgi:hypothetical protein